MTGVNLKKSRVIGTGLENTENIALPRETAKHARTVKDSENVDDKVKMDMFGVNNRDYSPEQLSAQETKEQQHRDNRWLATESVYISNENNRETSGTSPRKVEKTFGEIQNENIDTDFTRNAVLNSLPNSSDQQSEKTLNSVRTAELKNNQQPEQITEDKLEEVRSDPAANLVSENRDYEKKMLQNLKATQLYDANTESKVEKPSESEASESSSSNAPTDKMMVHRHENGKLAGDPVEASASTSEPQLVVTSNFKDNGQKEVMDTLSGTHNDGSTHLNVQESLERGGKGQETGTSAGQVMSPTYDETPSVEQSHFEDGKESDRGDLETQGASLTEIEQAPTDSAFSNNTRIVGSVAKGNGDELFSKKGRIGGGIVASDMDASAVDLEKAAVAKQSSGLETTRHGTSTGDESISTSLLNSRTSDVLGEPMKGITDKHTHSKI